jgi:hypothetical protein
MQARKEHVACVLRQQLLLVTDLWAPVCAVVTFSHVSWTVALRRRLVPPSACLILPLLGSAGVVAQLLPKLSNTSCHEHVACLMAVAAKGFALVEYKVTITCTKSLSLTKCLLAADTRRCTAATTAS